MFFFSQESIVMFFFRSKAAKIMWEEHEEDELRRLFMEFKEKFPDKELTNGTIMVFIFLI